MTDNPKDDSSGEVARQASFSAAAQVQRDEDLGVDGALDVTEPFEVVRQVGKEAVPHRETTRRLALWMLTLLISGVVLLAFAMVVFPIPGCHWDQARELLEITFVPLIALLSGVLGYYANDHRE